jgi:hypothetical protein
LIELFVDGKEDGLPDSGRLDVLGLGEGSVVFMLQRLYEWCWAARGSGITLSEDGLVATKETNTGGWQLVTGGEPMAEGRYYWEVEITAYSRTVCSVMIGAVRPGLDHNESPFDTHGACYIYAGDGALWGSGKRGAEPQGKFAPGDRVGVLLDLDAGWLRFYCNGERCGPGYTEGVTGPLVRAAELSGEGNKATVLPGAVAAEGAGAADEPWGSQSSGLVLDADY